MKRQFLVTVALFTWPAMAAAQSASLKSSAASSPSAIGLPLPAIGLPLPTIGLPLARIGLQPQPPQPLGQVDPLRGTPTDGSRAPDRGTFRRHPTIVYFTSPYAWGYEPPPQAPAAGISAAQVDLPVSQHVTGRLRLEVEPVASLQLYIDGEFVGTPQDVGAELELDAGSRRIEIRAPGYETLRFVARIVAQQTITYRGDLNPLTTAAPREASAPPRPVDTGSSHSQTFYLIPGCYMGNVPPQEVKLPADCDLSRLITHKP